MIRRVLRILGKLLLVIFLAAAGVVFLVGMIALSERLFLPEDYYFYQLHPLAEAAVIYLTVIPVVTFFGVIHGRARRRRDELLEEMYDLFFFWRRIGKARLILIVLWITCLYCCFTSATVVTGDKIICHTPLHPAGIVYDYGDVEQVFAGFGQKRFAVFEYQKKGTFSYQIVLDGKRKVFSTPSVNGNIARYSEETYLELEDFDQRLRRLGIPKTASEKGIEDCDLDPEYVERFRRIILY